MAEYVSKTDVLNLPQSIERNLCGEIVERSIDVKDIESLEPAEVVPVIRCKDCKYCESDDFCVGRGFPYQLVAGDEFCSRAKTKEHIND